MFRNTNYLSVQSTEMELQNSEIVQAVAIRTRCTEYGILFMIYIQNVYFKTLVATLEGN